MSYPIERYLNVQIAYMPSFASDGRSLAFISNITGRPELWQAPLLPAIGTQSKKGTHLLPPWPTQLTFAADRVMDVKHSPAADDPRLIYALDVGGDENAQLFLLDPQTGEERHLSRGHEGALHIPGDWSADGRFFLFAANRRHPGRFDLYRMAVESGQTDLLWSNETPGYLLPSVWSPDGSRIAVVRHHSSFHHDLFELEIASGTVTQLNPPDEAARFNNIAYSSDGRSLYVNTDLGGDFLQISRFDLDSQQWESVVADEWDIEHMALAPNGRWLAYAVNEDGASRLALHDLGDGTTRAAPLPSDAPAVVGMFDGRLRFDAASSRLAFSATSAVRTSDIFVWHLDEDDDRLYPVTRSSHGGIPTGMFQPPTLIRYRTFDEREIPAWFFRPAAVDDALPVVVMVHGGPEGQYRPYFNFLAHYLVHNGYGVLAPNVRGSTGYGKAYSHLDDVEKRMDSVTDLAHAVHWLRAQPGIDGDRIAVYGGSYGGFMVLSALTTYPDLWAAGVDIVGISSFVTFLENTSDYRRAHREAEYGSLERDRAFLESIAPINHLDAITAPLLVIHGANDPRVPVSEAEQLVAALKKRGVPVEFLVFDDEGHGIAKLKNKRVAYPAIVAFLDQYLSGG